jgi:hypothetical protein
LFLDFSELESFMRKNETEKAQLVERLNEQSETVHHLTHHVHLLQSSQEAEVSCPAPGLNVTTGTYGGKYPLFFSCQSDNKIKVDPWPMSDRIDQNNSVNMSHLSSSITEGQSFFTAPSTAVENGMHELYQRNRDLYEKSIHGTPIHKVPKARNHQSSGTLQSKDMEQVCCCD